MNKPGDIKWSWWSFTDIRTAGATTFLSSSISQNTHSSRMLVILKNIKIIFIILKFLMGGTLVFVNFFHNLVPEIALEQGMESIQEKFHWCQKIMRRRSQCSSSKQTESKTQGDKKGIFFVIKTLMILSNHWNENKYI